MAAYIKARFYLVKITQTPSTPHCFQPKTTKLTAFKLFTYSYNINLITN